MKKTASIFVLIISLAAALLANAGEPAMAPFDSATYDAIYTEAMQAVHKHQAAGEIPKELWGKEITKLKPLRVREYHGHVMIALKEDETSEEGLFVENIMSNYPPAIGPSDFSVLELLFKKPDDKSTEHKPSTKAPPVVVGILRNYKILKANLDGPAKGKTSISGGTNSSSSAVGKLP